MIQEVVLLPAVLSQNPVLIVLMFLFFASSAPIFLTVMRNAAEIDPEDAGVNIADVNTLSMAGLLFVLHWLATLLNTIQSPIRWHCWQLSGVVTEWACTSC